MADRFDEEAAMDHRDAPSGSASDTLPPQRGRVFSGAVAGLAGGVAMAGWIVLCAAIAGHGALSQLEPMGAAFRAPGAATGGAVDLLYGLALLLAYSAAAGVPFAALLPAAFPPGSAALVGVGYGMVLMAFSTSLFLPAVNPELREAMATLGGSWVLGYAFYGACLGGVPWLRRRRSARTPAPERHRTAASEGAERVPLRRRSS